MASNLPTHLSQSYLTHYGFLSSDICVTPQLRTCITVDLNVSFRTRICVNVICNSKALQIQAEQRLILDVLLILVLVLTSYE